MVHRASGLAQDATVLVIRPSLTLGFVECRIWAALLGPNIARAGN